MGWKAGVKRGWCAHAAPNPQAVAATYCQVSTIHHAGGVAGGQTAQDGRQRLGAQRSLLQRSHLGDFAGEKVADPWAEFGGRGLLAAGETTIKVCLHAAFKHLDRQKQQA